MDLTWPSHIRELNHHVALQAPTLLHEPLGQFRVWICLLTDSHLRRRTLLWQIGVGMAKQAYVKASAVCTRVSEKSDSPDSSPIHSNCILCRYLLFRISSAPSDNHPSHPALVFLFLKEKHLFVQKKWTNSHNHPLVMTKAEITTVSNLQFGRLRVIIYLNACELKHVSTFLGHSQVK